MNLIGKKLGFTVSYIVCTYDFVTIINAHTYTHTQYLYIL